MRFQLILAVFSSSLAVSAYSNFSRKAPATFYLQAIPVGSTSGSYLGFQYEPNPHNYGLLYNGSGSQLQPPGLFSFDTTESRLVYNLTGHGTYESQAPSNEDVIFFPKGDNRDSSGQLGSARDGSGSLYLLDLAYPRPSAFDHWYLCYNFTNQAGVTYLTSGTLGDFTCNQATVRIEKRA